MSSPPASEAPRLSDAHRHPFSLISNTSAKSPCKTDRVGDVQNIMDKSIGRPVLRIAGKVSANNYADFDNLHLTGALLYLQLRPLSGTATLHLEVLTSHNVPLRITMSTLYAADPPRFLGRSLRLPLPPHNGWMVIFLDLNAILAKYCMPRGAATVPTLMAIRRLQVCSNNPNLTLTLTLTLALTLILKP